MVISPETVHSFISIWCASMLKERRAVVFQPALRTTGCLPLAIADPRGEWFTFEKGAKKTGDGGGWADVWHRHYFAWEYRDNTKELGAVLRQLQQYPLALENPLLLVVWRAAQLDWSAIELAMSPRASARSCGGPNSPPCPPGPPPGGG
ncbi:MAG: SAM-dependent methyltransferase, partial [Proteobacteria bacterium]|nr:SAM-dependent methyltransferase [Pseudomonadota bacterium]